MRIVLVIEVALSALLLSCSSSPQNKSSSRRAPPAWISMPARSVDNGYIVYVGTGEDRSADRAIFKAESIALQDLGNECSFVPKGARIEDRYDELASDGTHHAYAKVGVEFQECEQAKNATTPEEIRRLASAPFTAQVKRYQELIDQPEPIETAPPTVVAANSQGSGGTVVQDTGSFFIVRQQVAYAKQVVILAPPSQYPPGAPVTTQPIPAVTQATSSIQQYANTHPEIRNGNQTLSNTRQSWKGQGGSHQNFAPQQRQFQQNENSQWRQPQRPKGKKRKKRRQHG